MPEQITFSGGQTESVYCVPQFIMSDLEGLPEYQVGPDDPPEVVVEKGAALGKAKERAALLYAFQDTTVPRRWKYPKSALREGLSPTPGEDGRLYDYIRYGLVVTSRDIMVMQRVMWGLTTEEVKAAEATFCARRHCPFRRRAGVVRSAAEGRRA